MKKFLDLRCSRRLTVDEGRLIVAYLNGVGGPVCDAAAGKLIRAIVLATHTCVGHGCEVCGGKNAAQRRLRARAAVQRLKKAPEWEQVKQKVVADARREALESRPVLKLNRNRFVLPTDGGAA